MNGEGTAASGMAILFSSEKELDLTIRNLQNIRDWKAKNSPKYPAIYAIFPEGTDEKMADRIMQTFKESATVHFQTMHRGTDAKKEEKENEAEKISEGSA